MDSWRSGEKWKRDTLTSWWADLRDLSVWRARRIFFSTYLSIASQNSRLKIHNVLAKKNHNKEPRWIAAIFSQSLEGLSHANNQTLRRGFQFTPYFFFSCLCLTRRAEPKAPFPICSSISYCSIPILYLHSSKIE